MKCNHRKLSPGASGQLSKRRTGSSENMPPKKVLTLHQQIQHMILHVSSNLIGLPVNEMAAEINKQLQNISQCLKFDRCCVLTFIDNNSELDMIFDYQAGDGKSAKTTIDFSQMPWYLNKIRSGCPIILRNLPEDLPSHASIEKAICSESGLKSIFAFPLSNSTTTFGILVFESFQHRVWPEKIQHLLGHLSKIFSKIIIQKKEEEKFDELFEFESILLEISTEFTELSVIDVRSHIERGLERIGKLLNADRVTLLDAESGSYTKFIKPSVYSWAKEGDPPLPKYADLYTAFPWTCSQLISGNIIRFSRLEELPDVAAVDRNSLTQTRTKSHISVPISLGGPVVGSLSITTSTEYRSWPDAIIPRIRLVGEVFSNSLARAKREMEVKKSSDKIKELFDFERILSEISSEFANLSARDIDKNIERGLERIGKFLKADRVNQIELSHETNQKHLNLLLNSWANDSFKPLPKLNDLYGAFPWVCSQLKNGEIVQFSTPDELPSKASVDKKTMRYFGTKSCVSVPIFIDGPTTIALSLVTVKEHRMWPNEIISRLRLLGEVFANALVRKKREMELITAFNQIKNLKHQIEADFTYLQEEINIKFDNYNMIGESETFKSMIYKIHQIADTDTTVLITGESGTGKEIAARAIHASSRRKNRPMVKVNCAALSSSLIESELFGHEKGAFTDAKKMRIGRFELANGNTLFLDEIGELPLASQAKLLRVLQEGEFERIGGSKTIHVDVRIIAATNRNLELDVMHGRFRQDLLFRLNIFPIEMPPLRRRLEDIPLFTNWFAEKFRKKLGKPILKIPARVMKALQNYHWPGNIRELENMIERAVIQSQGTTLTLASSLSNVHDLPAKADQKYTLDEVERNHILKILEQTRWRVSGPKGAALILDLHPSTLKSRMRKLNIR